MIRRLNNSRRDIGMNERSSTRSRAQEAAVKSDLRLLTRSMKQLINETRDVATKSANSSIAARRALRQMETAVAQLEGSMSSTDAMNNSSVAARRSRIRSALRQMETRMGSSRSASRASRPSRSRSSVPARRSRGVEEMRSRSRVSRSADSNVESEAVARRARIRQAVRRMNSAVGSSDPVAARRSRVSRASTRGTETRQNADPDAVARRARIRRALRQMQRTKSEAQRFAPRTRRATPVTDAAVAAQRRVSIRQALRTEDTRAESSGKGLESRRINRSSSRSRFNYD